jgi:hypothetical protein
MNVDRACRRTPVVGESRRLCPVHGSTRAAEWFYRAASTCKELATTLRRC